jgi:SH3-like domain-containing protein
MHCAISSPLKAQNPLGFRPRDVSYLWIFTLLGLLGGCQQGSPETSEDNNQTPSGKPIPRWEMTKSNLANGRVAPSKEAPRLIQFQKAGLPLQVISETKDFRLVCDPSGKAYWLSANLLRPSNRAIVIGPQPADLYKSDKPNAKIIARIRPKSLVRVDPCENGLCKVTIDKKAGYVAQKNLWGRQSKPVCLAPFQKP